MAEGIFSWLRRAKAQPGSGNVPDTALKGLDDRVSAERAVSGGRSQYDIGQPPVTQPAPTQVPQSQLNGVRSDAADVAAPVAAAGLAAGTAVKTFNPVEGNPHGPYTGGQGAERIPAGEKFTGGRTFDQNPGRFAQAGEAMREQAGIAGKQARGVAQAGLRAASGVGSAGVWAAKKVPGAAQVMNVADAASRASSEGLTPYERKIEGLRGVASMGGTALGGVAGGVLGAGAGTLVAPGPGTGAGAVIGTGTGAVLGQQGADWLFEKAFGPAKGKGVIDRLSDATAQPAGAATPSDGTMSGSIGPAEPQGGLTPEQSDLIRTQAKTEALRATTSPEAGGTGIPLSGAFRAAPVGTGGGRFDGAFDALSALQGYGAAGRLEKNDAELGLRRDQARLETMKFGYQMGKDQRDFAAGQQKDDRASNTQSWKTEFGARARIAAGEQGLGEKDPTYKNRIAGYEADFEKRARYGASNRKDGKRFEDFDQTDRSQMHDAIKIQDKVIGARGTLRQNLKDFFGNPQTDSSDPYSFMPARKGPGGKPVAATRDADGAIRVQTVNGNTIAVKEVGGKFNFFSSNDPVDADMLALMKPQIDEMKRQDKAKGK